MSLNCQPKVHMKFSCFILFYLEKKQKPDERKTTPSSGLHSELHGLHGKPRKSKSVFSNLSLYLVVLATSLSRQLVASNGTSTLPEGMPDCFVVLILLVCLL